MAMFLVTIWFDEKRKVKVYPVEAGSFAPAVGRALRNFKRDKLTKKRQRFLALQVEKCNPIKEEAES